MKVKSILIAAVTLVLLPSCGVRISAAQEPGAPKLDPPPKSEAHCLFRVIYDPASRLVNLERIKIDMLESPEVHAMVAAQVLGMKPIEIDKETIRSRFGIVTTGEYLNESKSAGYSVSGVMIIPVRIVSNDEKLPADKLLKAVGPVLQSQLQSMDDAAKNLQKTREILRTEVEASQNRLALLRKRVNDIKKLLGLSRDAAQLILNELQAARADLQHAHVESQNGQLQTQGLRARQQALERQVDALGKKFGEGSTHDPVVLELQKVVTVRERLFASVRALHKALAPGGGEDTLANAEGALAEARAELAKYQRVAAQSAGGERLAELNKRLADTQIELAEAEAQNEELKKRLEEAAALFERRAKEAENINTDSAEVDQLQAEIQIEVGQYRKFSGRLRDAELELKLHRPPTVTVIPQQ